MKSKYRKVKALLSNPERWCQEAQAVNSGGISVNSHSEYAVRWCVVGAHFKVGMVQGCIWEVADACFDSTPGRLNDGPNGFERIHELLDWCIGIDEAGGL